MIWASLAVVALLMGDRADNVFGRVLLWTFGGVLFVAALSSAPWSEVLA